MCLLMERLLWGGSTSGLSDAGGAEAFRWTGQEGMVGLGDLPGGRFESNARGVSGDGRVIVGTSHATTNNGEGNIPFIWTEEWGMRSLADVLIPILPKESLLPAPRVHVRALHDQGFAFNLR